MLKSITAKSTMAMYLIHKQSICETLCTVDPRESSLGARIISTKNSITISTHDIIECNTNVIYDTCRFMFSLAEAGELNGLDPYSA